MPCAQFCQQTVVAQPTIPRSENWTQLAKNRAANPAQLRVASRLWRGGIQKRTPKKAQAPKLAFERDPSSNVPFQTDLDLRDELFAYLLRAVAELGAPETSLAGHQTFPSLNQFRAKLVHSQERSHGTQVSRIVELEGPASNTNLRLELEP